MRVLVIGAHEGRGSVHTDKLLPSLRRLGHGVTYVGWDRLRALPRRWEDDGIAFRMIFRGWGYVNRRLLVGLPLWVVRSTVFLLRRRADVVVALDLDTGLPAALSSMVSRRPFVYNIRDNFALRASVPRRLRGVIAALDRWVIRRAVRVIVPDESRIVGIDEEARRKFVVIHNCALEVTPPAAAEGERPFTVYAMGYLRQSRGIGLLLDAAARLPGIRVLLAGRVPEPSLEARIRATPFADYRGHLPVREALELCFASDVVFAFYAPDSEINRLAISNKWSDAMMAGRPVLVNSEVLKSPWIEREGIGYACPYGDVDALERVLRSIRDDPDGARERGARARRLFEQGFSWSAMETRLGALMRDVAEEIGCGTLTGGPHAEARD